MLPLVLWNYKQTCSSLHYLLIFIFEITLSPYINDFIYTLRLSPDGPSELLVVHYGRLLDIQRLNKLLPVLIAEADDGLVLVTASLLGLSRVLASVAPRPAPEADDGVTPLSVTPEVPALDTVDEVTAVSEPEPEAESQPEPEPESEPASEAQVLPSLAEPEPETQSKAEPEPEAESEPEPEAESEPESEPYPESEAEPETEPESESESESEPEPELPAPSVSQSQRKPKSKEAGGAEPEPESESEPEPKSSPR